MCGTLLSLNFPPKPGVVDVLKVEKGAGGEDGDVVLPEQQGVQTEATLMKILVVSGCH